MSDDYQRGYRRGTNAPTDAKSRMMEVVSITLNASDDYIRGYGDAVQETGNGMPLDEIEEMTDRACRVMRDCGITAEEAAENMRRAAAASKGSDDD